MTFLSPWWLGAAAIMAAGVVVLHLLARRRPKRLLFPTARFIPDQPVSAAAMARRPTDLLLLLVRVLAVVLLGLAFAHPLPAPGKQIVQVVLLDRSRLAPGIDSAQSAIIQSADLVLAFDTSARVVDPSNLADIAPSEAPGSLSAGLMAALRQAPRLAARGDSIALTIISPFAREEWDAATLSIRTQWQGRISTLAVEPRADSPAGEQLVLPADDPLSGTLALLNPSGVFPARLLRGESSAADSAFASAGGALVIWPRTPETWEPAGGDTIGGVALQDVAVVAAFAREHRPPPGEAVALWADGDPAATLVRHGAGCIRNVAITLPDAGDLVLRDSFLRLTRELLAPCHGNVQSNRVFSAELDSIQGPASLLPSTTVQRENQTRTPAQPWLLLGAAALVALEPVFRRRSVAT